MPTDRPARMGDEITELTRDMLAQARGCYPENDCYHDCCEAAQSTIDGEYQDMMSDAEKRAREAELAAALRWAKTRRWVP